MTIKHLALMLCVLLLTACGESELKITSESVRIPITQVTDPTSIQMNAVSWKLVTKDNLDQFLLERKQEQQSDSFVFVALSIKDYENLTLNLAELRRYMEQQQGVIVYYRRMTAPIN